MRNQIKMYLLLIVLSLLWGSNFLLTTLLLKDFGVWFIVFFRCFIGMLGLAILLKALKIDFNVSLEQLKYLILVGVIGGVIPWTLMTYSQRFLSSSQGGLLNATSPMWFIILSFLFFKYKIKTMQMVGLLLGFTGLLYAFSDSIADMDLYSVLMALGAATFYSLTLIVSNKKLKSTNSLLISFYTLLITSVATGAVSFFLEPINVLALKNMHNVLYFIILGLLSSGLGYVIFFYLAKESDSGFASYVTYLIPIVAIIMGAIFLNESISTQLVTGTVIILFGIVLAENQYLARE